MDGLEDAVFENGAVKHAAQFTKTLEEIANYVQKKHNSDVAKMIKDVERPVLEFPARPIPKTILNSDGTITLEKVDEMDSYVWKKDYKLVHSKKAEVIEKEKRVFPSILDQCSPSLRSQLEVMKKFEEAHEKNYIVELLKLIRGLCCKHDQNNDKFYAVFNSLRALFINFQKSDQTNDEYLKEFQAQMAHLMTTMLIL